MNILNKFMPLREVKTSTETSANGTISGYFSVFGNKDRADEIVVKGAFAETLPEFVKSGYIAGNHEWRDTPIAMPIKAYEDEIGLFVIAEFHNTPKAQEMRTIVQERIDKGLDVKCSIGYSVKDAEYNNEGIRLLKSIELYECSIVNTPANPRAAITGVKSLLAGEMTLEEQHEMTLAVMKEYTGRIGELAELRAKDGRTISKQTRERLKTVADALDALDIPRSVLKELLEEKDPLDSGLDEQQRQLAASLRANALNTLRAAKLTAETLIS